MVSWVVTSPQGAREEQRVGGNSALQPHAPRLSSNLPSLPPCFVCSGLDDGRGWTLKLCCDPLLTKLPIAEMPGVFLGTLCSCHLHKDTHVWGIREAVYSSRDVGNVLGVNSCFLACRTKSLWALSHWRTYQSGRWMTPKSQ